MKASQVPHGNAAFAPRLQPLAWPIDATHACGVSGNRAWQFVNKAGCSALRSGYMSGNRWMAPWATESYRSTPENTRFNRRHRYDAFSRPFLPRFPTREICSSVIRVLSFSGRNTKGPARRGQSPRWGLAHGSQTGELERLAYVCSETCPWFEGTPQQCTTSGPAAKCDSLAGAIAKSG